MTRTHDSSTTSPLRRLGTALVAAAGLSAGLPGCTRARVAPTVKHG